jgi:hypothetical protein
MGRGILAKCQAIEMLANGSFQAEKSKPWCEWLASHGVLTMICEIFVQVAR